MFEGRSPQQKHDLVAAITRETCRVLGCDAASVDIIIVDVKRENWATAGTLWSEKGS